MTETPALPDPSSDPNADGPLHPSDILLNLIIVLLAPMFLAASGGDANFARAAAIQTISAYRAETQTDLIVIAQIIAFGLAALGSLSLSMADNLSPSMVLRLRNNANACRRSAEQNQRAIRENRPSVATSLPTQPESTSTLDDKQVIASVAAMQAQTAEALRPAPAPPPGSAPTPAIPDVTDQQRQAMWAAAAAHVAGEYMADLPNLPPAQRRAATLRAAMLSSCANDLLNGPPIPRVLPTDLAAALRSGRI